MSCHEAYSEVDGLHRYHRLCCSIARACFMLFKGLMISLITASEYKISEAAQVTNTQLFCSGVIALQ